MINNEYLKSLIADENIDAIEALNIEQNIDFSELMIFNNLRELKIYDLDLSIADIDNISKLQNLKYLFFINCNLDSLEGLVGLDLDTLYLSNTNIKKIKFIDVLNPKHLFLENIDVIDLNDISIIRDVEELSLNNSKVLNEDKMIYLDKIVNLSIANTGIKNIDTLVANETLKLLVIDDDIYNNNKEVVKALSRRGVQVVDIMNNSYEVSDA